MSGRLKAAIALVILALLLAAGAVAAAWIVGRSLEPESAPTTAPQVTTVTVEADETQSTTPAPTGREVYLAAGCSACHGLDAQGTEVGPALGGHGAAQVQQQVRNPLAQMPAYTELQISSGDLDLLAEYIAGLEPMTEHVEPVELPEALALHHWMAISAIAAEDEADALHHIGHVIEATTGEHRDTMLEARAALRRGELHEAEHLIEQMLAGKAKPDLTLAELNLRLALAAVDREDKAEAVHQMEHFVKRVSGAKRDKGKAVLAHLRENDRHGAEHGIADLLGVKRD